MIYLTFQYSREPLNFIVKGKEIYYTQRKFAGGNWIRCIPAPENFIRIVALSRNRIPSYIANIFKLTPEEMKEYETAKTEQELAKIIIRDAKSKGCIFVKQMDGILEEDAKRGVIN